MVSPRPDLPCEQLIVHQRERSDDEVKAPVDNKSTVTGARKTLPDGPIVARCLKHLVKEMLYASLAKNCFNAKLVEVIELYKGNPRLHCG